MSWFLQQFINAILQLVISGLSFIVKELILPLGLTPDLINVYFPSLEDFVTAFKILGLILLFVLVLFSLLRSILGEGSYGEKDSPVIVFIRAALAALLILYSMSAMNWIFRTFATPFYIIEGESGLKAFDVVGDEESVFHDSIEDSFNSFLTQAQEINDDTYQSSIDIVKDWIFPGAAILKALIELIAILLIGYKFIFLLLELIERYFLLMLQTYLSPLAFSTMATRNTSNIFKKWCEMLASNILLIYLEFFFLGIIVSSMKSIFNPDSSLYENLGFEPNFLLGSAALYVMIRIASSLSRIVERLLTTASTGNNLAREIFLSLNSLRYGFNRLVRPVALTTLGGDKGDHYSSEIRDKDPKDPDRPAPGGLLNKEIAQYQSSDKRLSENKAVSTGQALREEPLTYPESSNNDVIRQSSLENSPSSESLLTNQNEVKSPGINVLNENPQSSNLTSLNGSSPEKTSLYSEAPVTMPLSEYLSQSGISSSEFSQALPESYSDVNSLYIHKGADSSLYLYGTRGESRDIKELGRFVPVKETETQALSRETLLTDKNGNSYLFKQKETPKLKRFEEVPGKKLGGEKENKKALGSSPAPSLSGINRESISRYNKRLPGVKPVLESPKEGIEIKSQEKVPEPVSLNQEVPVHFKVLGGEDKKE